MYKSLDIDAAVELVKNIVENIRCAVCDKASGTRMRYACSHTCCEYCIGVGPDCSICLTPPEIVKTPATDHPLTQRAINAVNLLNTFQNVFPIDVYKRKRISEQLKVEKELFPECIQALSKYINKRKRKSSNKENRLSQLPGELVSIWDHKMEQSNGNVENWLNKYIRKPFADLNSNDERLRIGSSSIKKQLHNTDIENTTVQRSTRKRSHFKIATSVVKNQLLIDKHLTTVNKKEYPKKAKTENNSCVNASKYFETGNNTKTSDKNESGIVMDDDTDEAVVVIDDSQSVRVDKDYEAWLAVQEAENNKQSVSTSVISSKSGILLQKVNIGKETNNKIYAEEKIKNKIEVRQEKDNKVDVGKETDNKTYQTAKVPFFLKGYLSEKCIDCNSINKSKPESEKQKMDPPRDVSITVESRSFMAIIKVTNVQNNNNLVNSKQSVEVQTEISEALLGKRKEKNMNANLNHSKIIKEPTPIACSTQSQDMFKDDRNYIQNVNNNGSTGSFKSENRTLNVIIEESDSDGDIEAGVSLEVKADVHRSFGGIDGSILTDVDDLAEHSKRPRRTARGYTPTSTDSSDKENYNPNRKKKATTSKKKPMKK